ncbi:hypothetical protein RhiirA5_440386 [Rhizophagus irregularis]|uniref:Uncharacterized protein n=1 Tax=Rhizophagus irregularis TaxID=588596 RepID=A0A2N0NGS5_9GLOM|nr:hypothetical protein RhiirA5_440386 [Rhizophagus irregularis]
MAQSTNDRDGADDDHNYEDSSTRKVVSKSFGNTDIYYDKQYWDDTLYDNIHIKSKLPMTLFKNYAR